MFVFKQSCSICYQLKKVHKLKLTNGTLLFFYCSFLLLIKTFTASCKLKKTRQNIIICFPKTLQNLQKLRNLLQNVLLVKTFNLVFANIKKKTENSMFVFKQSCSICYQLKKVHKLKLTNGTFLFFYCSFFYFSSRPLQLLAN